MLITTVFVTALVAVAWMIANKNKKERQRKTATTPTVIVPGALDFGQRVWLTTPYRGVKSGRIVAIHRSIIAGEVLQLDTLGPDHMVPKSWVRR